VKGSAPRLPTISARPPLLLKTPRKIRIMLCVFGEACPDACVMKLYVSPYAPFPRRVMLYIALKGLDTIQLETRITIRGETRTPEFFAKNPTGKIPLLETDGGEFLDESQAIMQYLEELYPTPSMQGETETQRRRVDLQSALINEFYYYAFLSTSHTHPYVSRGLVQCHDIDVVTQPLWRRRLEQIAETMGSSLFLSGDTPTIPDCMLFGMLEYLAPLYGFVMPPHLKTMRQWYERFQSLPGLPLITLPDWYHDEYLARYGTRF
jgi:glutathione S-transferase